VNIYKFSEFSQIYKLHSKHSKNEQGRLYHDDNLGSFFRRLSFSPDGAILATPAGLNGDENTVYLFARGQLHK
jgi:chromatin assembly factor 1 subunit B